MTRSGSLLPSRGYQPTILTQSHPEQLQDATLTDKRPAKIPVVAQVNRVSQSIMLSGCLLDPRNRQKRTEALRSGAMHAVKMDQDRMIKFVSDVDRQVEEEGLKR